MNYEEIFLTIANKVKELPSKGNVADYIPELKRVNPDKFGVHLTTTDKQDYCYGDSEEKFSIQSISKVLSLSLAYNIEGENLWKRVGVEPSGTPFNSLVQIEYNLGIPRNPLINAGALVICDILIDHLQNPKEDFIAYIREISGIPTIDYSPKIAESEKTMGFRNAALINLMKSYGNITNNIEEVLDFYYYLCSIEMTCKELSKTFLYFATNGKNANSGKEIVTSSKAKRINAIMQTCGFYDEAGEFTFKVGLPGKSGVGGGIVAILPNQYCIAVWSPRLNNKGNSYLGMKFLELFTTETQRSIF